MLSQSPEAVHEVTFAVAHCTVVPGKIPAVAVLLESCKLIAAVAPVGVLTELLLEELLLAELELLALPLEELLLLLLLLVEPPPPPEEELLLLEELLPAELELLALLLFEELLPDELELLLEELLPSLEVGEPAVVVVLAPPPQALRIDTVARTASSCFVMGMILHTVRRGVFRNKTLVASCLGTAT